jgi:glycosyltransferase involved in cell wall biosynthesis
MDPNDPMGWDLRGVLIQTDLVENEDYKLLPLEYEESGAETELVNKIYNASDVYLTTTMGEGWGLTFSEAAACKIPIIAPYTTSFMEMSNNGNNAYMLYDIRPSCNLDNVIREQCEPLEVADVLVQVAKSINTEEHKKKIEDNYQWVKKLEWKNVCKSWIEYFKKTF